MYDSGTSSTDHGGKEGDFMKANVIGGHILMVRLLGKPG